MNDKKIRLFVPGRLCLFGEHSDWAGMYRTINSSLEKGTAIVSGLEQGIYANCETAENFTVTSSLPLYKGESLNCEMDSEKLLSVAREGGFFSYVAGVASYVNDNYQVGGLKITVTDMDLPEKSGLSSSAAICVLVARAFNRLYGLRMNTQGEMQAAFRGEQRTPSRCGRLDQACAYGVKSVLMEFDGSEIRSRELRIGTTFNWVVADLKAEKDTIKILADLNKCFPFAGSETDRRVQEAFGRDNAAYVSRAVEMIESGKTEELGRLMNEVQENFDRKVMPACSELKAPVLHSVLNDPEIKKMTLGAKGVGSQGDGSVQFLVRDARSAEKLRSYLEERGMPSFTLTLRPGQNVKKAIIPLAGFGTRVFPATKCVKKCFLPVPDSDGYLKPALMIMLEQLDEAGIEEICLVVGEEDMEEFEKFFSPVPAENYEKLPQDKKELQWKLTRLRQKITYVVQKERLGFGHAVYLCRDFTENQPVLLLLGDFLYKSSTDINCCRQVIDAFTECGNLLVSVQEVQLDRVVHYGIVHGQWENGAENTMRADMMVEKPNEDYAREYLGTENTRKEKKYYATFGQYVLTPEVFAELDKAVKSRKPDEGETGLTEALKAVMDRSGMTAFRPDGKCYDIGLPEEYRKAVWDYCLPRTD